ncbi:MAG: DUF348 domain-containing protein [Anaerolineae bacterium]|nr:DUF348 domain-containing protein [Anaerolineae bacterium]
MASEPIWTQSAAPRPFLYRFLSCFPAGLMLIAVLVALLLVGGSLLLVAQKTITVDLDGQVTTLYTYQATVGDLLAELDVRLAPEDALSPPPEAWLENGAVIRVRRAATVYVVADGRTLELQTRQRAPLALLAEAGITLGTYDTLRIDGQPVPDPASYFAAQPPGVVEVLRAVALTIVDGEDVHVIHTTEPTVGAALYAAGLTIYLADAITPPPGTPVQDGLRVTIWRSVPVTVTVDGVTVATRTLAATVGAALMEAGLPLVGEDYSLPPPEAPLPADGQIRVVRVTEDVRVTQWEIACGTLYRADAALALDEQRIMRAGVPGVMEQRTRIRYEDGIVVSEVEEPPRVRVEPVDEIIAYGTQIVLRTLETPQGPLTYWRVIRMLATSYSPGTAGSGRSEDSPSYGIASTGVPVTRGIVAVDPAVIPYHTRVYVPGYGQGLAEDTGGAINGRRIDLGYSDEDLELWYGWVDVYLLTPVPPPDDILYVLP